MIFDQLVLENIGVFAGRNEIDLTPPGDGRPVILLGGLNGAGKTTILESVRLALYGPLAEGSPRRPGKSYEAYLRSLVHRPSSEGTAASVELAFHAFSEGASRSYRVRRAWRDVPGAEEQLRVDVDGVPDQAAASSWASFIEGFLPRGIAGLFFFDGERIESLADLEQSQRVLSSALSSLLGLELVDRLSADLAVIRRRHRSAQVPAEVTRSENETEDAWKRACAETRAAADALEASRSTERLRAQEEKETAAEYRARGGDLFEHRQDHKAAVDKLQEERKAHDDGLRELAAGAAPFLQVLPALEQLTLQARKETTAGQERTVLKVLGTRDRDLIGELRRAGAAPDVLKAADAFLDADRQQRTGASAAEPVTGLPDSTAAEHLTRRLLPETGDRLRAQLGQRDRTIAELEAAERVFQSIPDEDALLQVREAHGQAQRALKAARTGTVRAEERHRTLSGHEERARAAWRRARERAALADLEAGDSRRLTVHAERAQATLETLKTAVTERHVSRISGHIMDALRILMRKENLITGISIDPSTYAIELRGPAGLPLGTDQLSVGERQMLAVAMLRGLAAAARQPLPVIIDTPLGRLDSSHRGNLIERYFPSASHQVLLLSTDTEITEEARRRLAPHTGRSYRLEFDPSKAATAVRPGYFLEP